MLASLLLLSVVGATNQRWEGTLQAYGRVLRIGLQVSAKNRIDFDSPSLYLPSKPCAHVVYDKTDLRAELPNKLGTLRLGSPAQHASGTVTFPDGTKGSVVLTSVPSRPYLDRPVSFTDGDISLSGEVLVPPGKGPFPGILVVHGGGNSVTRDESYWFWMEYLVRRGFEVIGWDKRGCGKSTGAWRKVGFDALASDVVAAAEELSRQPEVKRGNIGAIGFSQGGWVAPLACTKTSLIRYVAVVSGPLVSPQDADKVATRNAYLGEGLSASEADEAMALWDLCLAGIADPTKWGEYVAAFDRIKRHDWIVRTKETPMPENSWFVSWYRLVKDYDPLPPLRSTNIPILWMYGASDSQQDPRKSVVIAANLALDEKKNYSVHLFPGLAHGLGSSLTAKDAGPFAIGPGVLETLDAWLAERAR